MVSYSGDTKLVIYETFLESCMPVVNVRALYDALASMVVSYSPPAFPGQILAASLVEHSLAMEWALFSYS